MNDSPDVSVVMSVYNGADHLRETLDSILAQEGVVFELVVVNDGSTDQSAKILEEYASKDKRVRVFRQENQGLTRSLIRGCSEARGKYVARHDVGDTSDPKRLLLQKAALDNAMDLAFASCWTEFCGPEWEFLYMFKGTGHAASPAFVISETEKHGVIDGPTHHGSVMFRKDCYLKAGGYRAEFYYGQDWDLWFRLAEVGRFQTLWQTLYRARMMPGSLSLTNKRRQEAIAKLSLEALMRRRRGLSEKSVLGEASAIRPGGAMEISRRERAAGMYFIGEVLRKNGDPRAARFLAEAVRGDPLSPRFWLRLLQMKIFRRIGQRGGEVF